MQIETYSGKYDEIISLILDIQNNESKINLSLEEQPDLLTIHDSWKSLRTGLDIEMGETHFPGSHPVDN